MLDTTLFNVQLASTQASFNNSLILTGCVAKLQPEGIVYSELDEVNYYLLNNNDFGAGRMDIEFCFENTWTNPYFKFFAQCFTIRTDNGVLRKINQNPMPRILRMTNYSKVNKDNKLVIGICYYFQDYEERREIFNCREFCIEGFIALKRKTKVYGIMCRIEKKDDDWYMNEGNTYQIYKRTRIDHLWH